MPAAVEQAERLTTAGGGSGFAGGGGRPGHGGGGGGDSHHDRPGHNPNLAYTGMLVALVPILMFFIAFISAYVVRRGISNDWQPIALPMVLWVNTLALLLSSYAMEKARRALAHGNTGKFQAWWIGSAALGIAFIGGQFVAWRQMWADGIFLAGNPSSSFFFILTAAHGVHLAGGLIALLYVTVRAARAAAALRGSVAVGVTALYWHFMAALWMLLFLLLVVWQ